MLTKEDILKDGHDDNDEGMQVDGDDDNEARMQVDSVDQQCTDEQYTETEDNNEYFLELLKADTTVVSDGNSLKSDISDLAHQITSQTYSCHNNDILRTVKKQMQSAFSLMNHHNAVDNDTDSETVFQKTLEVAPNSNSSQQLRFHSTKNKRSTKKRWAKPDRNEEENTKSKMRRIVASVCGICWKEEDREQSNGTSEIKWLGCEICGLWVHKSCTKQNSDNDQYICSPCIKSNTQ